MYLQHKNQKIITTVTPDDTQNLIHEIFLGGIFKLWDCENDPEKYLFYWFILSNRIEIAKTFWRLGSVYTI